MRGRLYRLVYLWIKDQSLAEDALQNVFEKSVSRQNELQTHPNLMGWMVKSLRNEVLMHHRKNDRLQRLEEYDEPAEAPVEVPETEESHRLVFEFVGSLPPKQQDVFLLREVEEMSYEEISTHLEISIDQVKVNLHRARKTLREKLINQGITR
jgi:RNA polymerase sigma factor (sigma-70 family)